MLIRMPSHEGMEWNESACHEKCGFPEISLWEDKSLTRHPTFSENTREAELQAFYELLTMLRHRGPIRLGTVDPGCRYQNPRANNNKTPQDAGLLEGLSNSRARGTLRNSNLLS